MKKISTSTKITCLLLLLLSVISMESMAQSGKRDGAKSKTKYKLTSSSHLAKAAAGGGCNVDTSTNFIYYLLDEHAIPYQGFLCDLHDSLSGTFANGSAYFDGDGYLVNLYAGDQVTFSIDSCTGNPASLTLCDSANVVIPGAYSSSACNNSLSFTATYTGSYIIVINVGGICGGGGGIGVGEIYVKGTSLSTCAAVPANDSICGAVPLVANAPFLNANTISTSSYDASDDLISNDLTCSTPNNTLWYSYTAPSTGNITINFTSPAGNGLTGYLGVFEGSQDCNDPLTYVDCYGGPSGIADTISTNIAVTGGTTYYFVVVSVNGLAGPFSIGMTDGTDGCNGNPNAIYFFSSPAGGPFAGYLCDAIDSVSATGGNQYYDGDGYIIKLFAGSQVTFSSRNCTGHPVSLTICDSTNAKIPGSYSPAACDNSLDFTAPYTGSYIVVVNENGVCGGAGSSPLGDLFCVRQTGTALPACDPAPVNDTICGAISLVINDPLISGSTINALPTDPSDTDVINAGYVCSPPNNTLWYAYTPATTDSVDVILTAGGSGFMSWLGVFSTASGSSSCQGALTIIGGDCLLGTNNPLEPTGDTLINRLYFTSGNTYYIMVDGYSGDAGSFNIGVEAVISGLNDFENNIRSISVFPNPVNDELNVKYNFIHSNDVKIQLFDVTGRVVLNDALIEAKNGQKSINVSAVNNGVYILRLSNGSGSTSYKVMVQH